MSKIQQLFMNRLTTDPDFADQLAMDEIRRIEPDHSYFEQVNAFANLGYAMLLLDTVLPSLEGFYDSEVQSIKVAMSIIQQYRQMEEQREQAVFNEAPF